MVFLLSIIQWNLGRGNKLPLFQFHSSLEVTVLIPTMTIIHTKHHEIWCARSRHSFFLKQDYIIFLLSFSLALLVHLSPCSLSNSWLLLFCYYCTGPQAHAPACAHIHTHTQSGSMVEPTQFVCVSCMCVVISGLIPWYRTVGAFP